MFVSTTGSGHKRGVAQAAPLRHRDDGVAGLVKGNALILGYD